MSVMDGLEAARRIRALPAYAETPILAMTANAFAEDKADCLAAGMNDFVVKPFDPNVLFATLLHWLDRSQGAGIAPANGADQGAEESSEAATRKKESKCS